MTLKKRAGSDNYYMSFQIDGVIVRESTKTADKRLAEQIYAKRKGELFSEVVVKGRKPIKVEKALALFRKSRIGTAGAESLQVKTRVFETFAGRNLHEIKAHEVLEAVKELQLAPTITTKNGVVRKKGNSINTANVSIVYWNSIQNYVDAAGFTPGPKVEQFKGGNGRVRFLSQLEVTKLLNELHPSNPFYYVKLRAQDNYDFALMLLETGAREQEMAKLKLSQINEEAQTLTVYRSKGGTDTTFPLSTVMKEVIARRMAAAETPQTISTLHGRVGNDFLFPEKAKGKNNNDWIGDAGRRCGVQGVTEHVLRHTYACNLLQSGVRIDAVQRLLGHKNLETTMRYLHLVPGAEGVAAREVLDAQAAARDAAQENAKINAVSAANPLRLVA